MDYHSEALDEFKLLCCEMSNSSPLLCDLMLKVSNDLKTGLVDIDLLENAISQYFDIILSDSALVEDFFDLLNSSLLAADKKQFDVLIGVLIETYTPLLRTAIADIWVFISAGTVFEALSYFLQLFKQCALSRSIDFQKFRIRLNGDLALLFETCVDVAQNCSPLISSVGRLSQLISVVVCILCLDQNWIQSEFDVTHKLTDLVPPSVLLTFMKFLSMEVQQTIKPTSPIIHVNNSVSSHADSDDELSSCPEQETPIPENDAKLSKLDRTKLWNLIRKVLKHTLSRITEWTPSMEYEFSATYRRLQAFIGDELLSLVPLLMKSSFSDESLSQFIAFTSENFTVHTPKSTQLRKLFSFAYRNALTMETVMKGLRKVLEANPIKPSFSMCFPRPSLSDHVKVPIEWLKDGAACFVIDPMHKVTAHDGMTVSFWLRLDKSKVNRLTHIISVGTRDVFATAYLHPRRRHIIFWLTVNGNVVERALFRDCFKNGGEWVNMMLGLCICDNKVGLTSMVGCKFKFVSEHVADIQSASMETMAVSFGSCESGEDYELTYQISSMFGVLPMECGIILRTMAPRETLSRCVLSSVQYSFFNCINDHLIIGYSDLHKLCANPKPFLDKIQRSVLFVLDAKNPTTYGLSVLQPAVKTSEFKTVLEPLLLSVSQEFPVIWKCGISVDGSANLDSALQTIGYIKAFIFSYALSVDKYYGPDAQLAALSALHVAVKRDPVAHYSFTEMDGPNILMRILSSPNAHFDMYILNAICNLIFSNVDFNNSQFRITSKSAIVDAETLKCLINTVALWQKDRFVYFIQMVQLICDLVSSQLVSEHFRRFNFHQLCTADFLETFLYTLLEICRSSHDYFVSSMSEENLPKQIDTLIRCLVESPFSMRRVNTLWKFVQMSHPANANFVKEIDVASFKWIRDGIVIPSENTPEINHSELRGLLETLSENEENRERIKAMFNSGSSITSIRKEFIMKDEGPLVKIRPLFSPNLESKREPSKSYSTTWIEDVRANSIAFMTEIVLNCADPLMACIELDLVHWNSIVVMLTGEECSTIRTNIFSLLSTFLLRCEAKYRNSFTAESGFVMIASELRENRDISPAIINSLFSLTCGEPVCIEDGLDVEHLESLCYDEFRLQSLNALFALLELSVSNDLYFWNICSTLEKMYNSSGNCKLQFLENGLAAALVNSLRGISTLNSCERLNGPVFPLLDCWLSFCKSIIQSTVAYSNPKGFSRCEDFVRMLVIAAINADTPATKEPQHCGSIRRMLCCALICWIESIEIFFGDFSAYESNYIFDFEVLNAESDSSDSFANGSLTAAKVATIEELCQRFMLALKLGNFVFLFLYPTAVISDEEEALFSLQLEHLMWIAGEESSRISLDRRFFGPSNRTRALSALFNLLAFVFYPIRQKTLSRKGLQWDFGWLLERRLSVVRKLVSELTTNRGMILQMLDANLDYEHAICIGVHELSLLPNLVKDSVADANLDKLSRFLKSKQIFSPLAKLEISDLEILSADERLLYQSFFDKERESYSELSEKGRTIFTDILRRSQSASENANVVTRNLAETLDFPRRAFAQWKRDLETKMAESSEKLYYLVTELTHPEGIFHDPHSWPLGFALSATESVRRERRVLHPSHYNFPPKFLREPKQGMVKNMVNAAPLDCLLEGTTDRFAAERAEASKQTRQSFSVTLIQTAFECSGEIVISDWKLYFLGDVAKSTQKGKSCSPVSYSWKFDRIREVHFRYYLLKDTALEIFTTTGDAFLIVFSTFEQRKSMVSQLEKMKHESLFVNRSQQLNHFYKLWRNGSLTNFEYLNALNKLAGRSFNDLMQYPIFPFILSDYTSSSLDLNSASCFRALSRPMAIQDRQMESVYIQNYYSLLDEYNRRSGEAGILSPNMGPYHYGSHYSNSGIVAHYMVRVLPYTNVALEYQDNNFDIADRLFNNLSTTWRLSSSESTTDFKELIPEFFFFPEMFQNRECLELGVRQSGQQVNNVNLPPWCPQNNARLFCLIHRQALESPIVSSSLHEWIDLIFGYKQQGENAVQAINVFHPATYRGRNLDAESNGDELYACAIRTMIRTYGQMPDQLFASPHMPRMANRSIRKPPNRVFLLPSVHGIRFGDFFGSPETDIPLHVEPVSVFHLEADEVVDHLAFGEYGNEGVCFGVPKSSAMVLKYTKPPSDGMRQEIDSLLTAVVSWGFTDRVLRVKRIQLEGSVWVNLLDTQNLEVSRVVYSPVNELLYVGFKNGLIKVFKLRGSGLPDEWSVSFKGELFAHSSSISSITVSDNFHILLTTSEDTKICLWDSNRLEFIRRIKATSPRSKDLMEKITMSCVSGVSADIAVTFESANGSRVSLYTVNGDLIGSHCEDVFIRSIAMTNLDEGTHVNCLALGLSTGTIRLLEIWTMTTIRVISSPSISSAVISLQFDGDCRRLYAALSEPSVRCWQTPSLGRNNLPIFKMLTPYL